MAQEFTINSSAIESKINQLLPSQGGFAPGVDFSASTMVIPIVDLTETAEGSNLRQDLQSAFSLASNTSFAVTNGSSNLITTTGYWRVFGTCQGFLGSGALDISLTDGTTTKIMFNANFNSSASGAYYTQEFDFNVFMPAGTTLTGTANGTSQHILVTVRQLADLAGNLVSPI